MSVLRLSDISLSLCPHLSDDVEVGSHSTPLAATSLRVLVRTVVGEHPDGTDSMAT